MSGESESPTPADALSVTSGRPTRVLRRLDPWIRCGLWVAAALWISADFHKASVRAAGRFALPLDDAYIYLRYGEHFFRDGPYTYGPGEPVTSGATSMLYPWIPGILSLAGVPTERLPDWVFWISAVLLGLMAHLAFELTRRIVTGPEPRSPDAGTGPPGPVRPDGAGDPGGIRIVLEAARRVRPHLPPVRVWAGVLSGFLAGCAVVRSPFVVWGVLIGMEGGLYGCVLLCALLLWARASTGPQSLPVEREAEPAVSLPTGLRRWFSLGPVPGESRFFKAALLVCVGLLPLCRPEGLLPAVGLAALAILFRVTRGRRLNGAALWAIAFAPWLIGVCVHWAATGQFSPNTAVAKSVLHEPLSGATRQWAMMWNNLKDLFDRLMGQSTMGRPMLNWTALTVGLALMGLAAGLGQLIGPAWQGLKRFVGAPGSGTEDPAAGRRPIPGLGLAGVALAGMGALAGLMQNRVFYFDHHRYALGLLLMILVLAVAAFGLAAVRLRLVWLLPIGAIAVIYSSRKPMEFVRKEYANGARDTAVFQIAAARFVRHHLPSGIRLGVNDAGAIPFYSKRKVLDIVGLTTGGMALPFRHGNGSLFEALENLDPGSRPTHFAVFPRYLRPAGLLGRLLFRPRARRIAGAAGNVNTVYEARWASARSGHALPDPGSWVGPGVATRAVDRVDVADLRSESTHRYRNPRPDLKWSAWRVNYSLVRHEPSSPIAAGKASGPVTDGGRPVVLSEKMSVHGCPRAPCFWVARVATYRAVSLAIVWGGKTLGTVRLPAGPRFRIVHLDLGKTTDKPYWLEIRVINPVSKKPAYVAYHHWIGQLTAPSVRLRAGTLP